MVALRVLVLITQAIRERDRKKPEEGKKSPAAKVADPLAEAVRESLAERGIGDAVLASGQWPRIRADLTELSAAGVDVRQFLREATPFLERVDAERATATAGNANTAGQQVTRDPYAAPAEETPTREATERRTLGEWFAGLRRRTMDPEASRAARLDQHGISPQQHTQLVIMTCATLADESRATSLVMARGWPDVAARMVKAHEAGRDPRSALAAVPERIAQAKAAGIELTSVEAASGLLRDAERARSQPTKQAAPGRAEGTTRAAGQGRAAGAAPGQAPPQSRSAAAAAKSTTVAPGTAPAPRKTASGARRPKPTGAPQQGQGRRRGQ